MTRSAALALALVACGGSFREVDAGDVVDGGQLVEVSVGADVVDAGVADVARLDVEPDQVDAGDVVAAADVAAADALDEAAPAPTCCELVPPCCLRIGDPSCFFGCTSSTCPVDAGGACAEGSCPGAVHTCQ